MNDVLLYGNIWGAFTIEAIIDQITALEKEGADELTLRINTNGGAIQDCMGLYAKFQSFPGTKKMCVDGKAFSAGAFSLCYADQVEALDVSQFLLHRAAYPSFIENSPEDYPIEMQLLENVNKNLRKALEAKVDSEKFEEITGTSIKALFSMNDRKDVILTASQAKQLGLVNKIIKITPAKAQAITSHLDKIAASYGPEAVKGLEAPKAENPKPAAPKKASQTKIYNKMNKEQLKAEHPELYNSIFAEAKAAGAKEEKTRVLAFMEFNDVDPEAVKKGIEEDETLDALAMAKFSKKMMGKEHAEKIEAGAEGPTETPELKPEAKKEAGEKKEEAEEMEAAKGDLFKSLGLKTEAEA